MLAEAAAVELGLDSCDWLNAEGAGQCFQGDLRAGFRVGFRLGSGPVISRELHSSGFSSSPSRSVISLIEATRGGLSSSTSTVLSGGGGEAGGRTAGGGVAKVWKETPKVLCCYFLKMAVMSPPPRPPIPSQSQPLTANKFSMLAHVFSCLSCVQFIHHGASLWPFLGQNQRLNKDGRRSSTSFLHKTPPTNKL